MTRSPIVHCALLLIPLAAACGPPDELASSDGDLAARPTPFAAQFTGTYLGSGALSRLELRPDGTYSAVRSGKIDHGTFTAARTKALPLTLRAASGHAWQGRVTAYDGQLHLSGEDLTLQRPAASDEDLCDGSGGSWTDDDPDPRTGLYCVCPAAELFIPAAGGCVARQ